MRISRAAFSGPRRVELEAAELAVDALAPHELVLRTRYSAISPGTELAYYRGHQDLGHRQDPYPFHPGYAAAGEVIATGDATGFRPGDAVLAHTPHQSAARLDCRRTVCVRLPAGLEPRQAPLARLAQVGAVSVRRVAARPGARAAVVGLGPVGNLAAQLLRCAGMRTVGLETMPERRSMAARCGLPDTYDPAALADGPDAVADLAASRVVVLECSGRDPGVLAALRLAAPHGEVFLVGAAWRRDPGTAADDVLRAVFDKYLALRSGWEWQIPLYGGHGGDSIAACTEWVLGLMAEGTLRTAELITDVVQPGELAAAYDGLLDDPARHMGVIVAWD